MVVELLWLPFYISDVLMSVLLCMCYIAFASVKLRLLGPEKEFLSLRVTADGAAGQSGRCRLGINSHPPSWRNMYTYKTDTSQVSQVLTAAPILNLPQVQGDDLLRSYEQLMCTAVCQVGADLNLAASVPWRAATLQFVAGLGPRKAALLLKTVQRNGNKIAGRRDLYHMEKVRRGVPYRTGFWLSTRTEDCCNCLCPHCVEKVRRGTCCTGSWCPATYNILDAL